MNCIYLHGFCSSPDSAKGRFFRQRFEEMGAVLAVPDLNEGGFEGLTISRMLQQVERTAERFSGELTLFGSSLGGYVAVLYALQARRVTRLVLLAPAMDFIQRERQRQPPEYFEEWRARGQRNFFHHGLERDAALAYTFVEDAERYTSVNLGADIPALVVQGLHDDVVPMATALDYMKKNREAQLLALHSDHQLRECTDSIWRHVRAFLGD
ncbi:MAG: alpha/beta fold hydrolase [Leptospirales bacterium]|nr:alpha/beta fold hydrolase [Leptospirales bacterium]